MDQETTHTEESTVPTEDTSAETTTPDMPVMEESAPAAKRSMLFFAGIAAVVLAVGGVAAWHFLDIGKDAPAADVAATGDLTAEQAAEPIAFVNGIAITRGSLAENVEQMKQGAMAQGADPNDLVIKTQIEEQAYEVTVNNELLKQAAEKDAPRPSDADVDAEIARLTEQNGGEEAFAALLAEVGFTKELLRENVTKSLHIKAYLASKQTPSEVTDEEINEFYNSLGGETAGLPPLEEVREQVIMEIERQKADAQIGVIIEELRAAAKIEKA